MKVYRVAEIESEDEEPVEKPKKVTPQKVLVSSVKQHQSKVKHVNYNSRPNEINKLKSNLRDIKVVLNRIVISTEQQEKQEDDLKFRRAHIRAKNRRMCEYLKPVDSLCMDGNLSENWRIFKRNYDIFAIAKGLDEKTDPVKINTFLNAIGKEAVEVFDTFTLTPDQKANYTEVVKAFEDFCKERKNVVFERYTFGSRNQKKGEPFDTFLMDIKKLARTCEFTEEHNMIRDRIVIGTTDTKLREKLLVERNLTMDQAIEKARSSETTRKQAQTMNGTAENEINSIGSSNANQSTAQASRAQGQQNNNKYKSAYTQNSSQNRKQQQRNAQGSSSNGNSKANNKSKQQQPKEIKDCTRCGRTHKVRECPAFGKSCRSCNKLNHYSSMCRQRTVATIETHTDSDSSEYFIGTLNKFDETPSEASDSITFPWIEKIKMNEKKVDSKIDTGAETDVLPLKVLKQIAPKTELRSTKVTLRAFGGQKIKPTGMCTLLLSFNGITFRKNFAVVDQDFVPIIGLKTCIRLGIVQPSRVYKNKNYIRKQL